MMVNSGMINAAYIIIEETLNLDDGLGFLFCWIKFTVILVIKYQVHTCLQYIYRIKT